MGGHVIHVIKWTRPPPSVFAYCKRFKTGRWESLGTRLEIPTYALVLPRPHPLMRNGSYWALSCWSLTHKKGVNSLISILGSFVPRPARKISPIFRMSLGTRLHLGGVIWDVTNRIHAAPNPDSKSSSNLLSTTCVCIHRVWIVIYYTVKDVHCLLYHTQH